jgi:hypothetical protein
MAKVGQPTAEAASRSAVETLMPVLGAIAGGLGVLGFVTFFGGAVVWARAQEAGLPALDVVAAVPNSLLLATGVHFLVPALLVALCVPATLLTVHGVTHAIWRWRFRDEHERARSARRDAHAAALEAQQARLLYTVTVKQASADVADPVAQRAAQHRDTWMDKEDEADARVRAALAAEETLERTWAKTRRDWAIGRRVTEGVALFLVPFLIASALGVDAQRRVLPDEELPRIVCAVGLVGVTMFVYIGTERILWAATAAFVGTALFIGIRTFDQVRDDLKVEPAAALRDGDAPVTGMFVADTGDQLYIGTFRNERDRAQLVVIPKSDVTEYALGPPRDPDVAQQRALELEDELTP